MHLVRSNDHIFFAFIFLPLVLGLFHAWLKKASKVETLLDYYLFISVGIQGLLTGAIQIFQPQFVVSFVQWPYSPFLLELGVANVSYGVIGVMSIFKERGWKTATAFGYAIFLLFTGIRHLLEIIQKGASPGNSGTFLLFDLFVSLGLFILLALQKNLSKKEVGFN